MANKIREEVNTKVEVILDPVNPDDFPCSRNEHRGKRVMFHGLITKNKGVDLLLEAAQRLPNIDFWIIGGGPDLDRLKKIASSNVRFIGWRSFYLMPFYLQTCDIGVAMRSNNPGNDFVVTSPFLQYSVMGKPCLVSRRKVFEDMKYLWQFSNVEELVDKINILLEKKEEGRYWQEYVLNNHNAKDIACQIMQALLS
jgi:glycosyltransferase involved in cell wall biosynthesis